MVVHSSTSSNFVHVSLVYSLDFEVKRAKLEGVNYTTRVCIRARNSRSIGRCGGAVRCEWDNLNCVYRVLHDQTVTGGVRNEADRRGTRGCQRGTRGLYKLMTVGGYLSGRRTLLEGDGERGGVHALRTPRFRHPAPQLQAAAQEVHGGAAEQGGGRAQVVLAGRWCTG